MKEGINHRAKKSLGQNFLKSKKALSDIVSAAKIEAGDIILEVGPGKGILTEELLKKAGKVIAIEKDESLVSMLQEKFAGEIENGKLEIIAGDILDFDPKRFKFQASSYKVVANIPYYITGQFLRNFLSSENYPSLMVLLLQKEVVKRIVASDKKESILSMSVKAYGAPDYIDTVQARYFSPEPKVDSAIIAIRNISKAFFNTISEEKFFEVMKAGFAHKRKMLLGNLKESNVDSRENLEKIFVKCDIKENARAEDLKLEDWKRLIENLK
jgi:16S rRNA (adenine1518-N6/adenine1519-N6)-dimethyltransferase